MYNGLSDGSNQHPTIFFRCQEQVAYVNIAWSFLGAGTYTASNNTMHLKSNLATRDYLKH